MKDKVNKEQVAENVNKPKEPVITAIGSEATVLQLSQQVALDGRDMDMDTTEGEVQKELAEIAGVPVEAIKVKAMRPMYGSMQIAIVTMPRMTALHIIKSGKVRIGWVIARIRGKISVPRCFRCTLGTSRATTTKKTMQQNSVFYAGPCITLPRPAATNRCAPSARRLVPITDIGLGAQNALL